MKRLRKERFYPVSAGVVWEALTDPAALAEWLMPNNFRAQVGATFELVTDPTPICGSGITRCQVVELATGKRMVWTWQRDAGAGRPASPPMTVAWTLVPEKAGTRLILEQTGLEGQGWLVRLLMNVGWGMMLRKRLPLVLANVAVQGGVTRFTPGAVPMSKRYYRCKTVPALYLQHGESRRSA
jgi:uncharacterized protein YndB with AHSA1/START domain